MKQRLKALKRKLKALRDTFLRNRFLFEELVKRDFTKNINALFSACFGASSAR